MPPTGEDPEGRGVDETAVDAETGADTGAGSDARAGGTAAGEGTTPGGGAPPSTKGSNGARSADDDDGARGGGADDGGGATLAERRRRAAEAASRPRRGGWRPMVLRYGPFAAAAVILAAAVAVFGSGGGGGGREGAGAGGITIPSEEELIRSGPMTPQRAELEGAQNVDFGPHCDTATGRLQLPTISAPPCVERFEGGNGGATSKGVTGDEILIIRYTANTEVADPQGVSSLLSAGVDMNTETMAEALDNYTRLYNEVFETYGRTVRVEEYVGTGAGSDRERARADAIAIAEREPFAVVGGPWEAGNVFAVELAERNVICGPGCALAQPDSLVEQYYPYIWLPGSSTAQGSQMLAEIVSKLAGPGPAEMAGDEETRQEDRRYALLHYDTPDGDFTESFESMRRALRRAGISLETHIEFELDLTTAQEDARTIISRLKGAGVTTIIYTGDPLTPTALTAEATTQDYHPEWILGPSAFGEYAILARMFDSEQWGNGFGLSWGGARVANGTGDAAEIYRWAFGEEVPNRTALLSEGTLRWAFQGIHMAGPDLTPETFAHGLFRTPPTGGGPTAPHVSWGDHGVWDQPDLGSTDDVTLIWWDPEASGVDEMNQRGEGMYRYANGGARYRPGEIPDSPEEAGLFDRESSILTFDERPPEDLPPEYPPPDLPG